MTYDEFEKLWNEHALVFACSPKLHQALQLAADGDFTEFDKIDKLLTKYDLQ